MNLPDNKELLTELLYDAIRSEARRIVKSGLGETKQVMDFINEPLKASMGSDEFDISDAFIDTLGNVHRKLLSIKLPGDINILTAKVKENITSEAKSDCHCEIKTAEIQVENNINSKASIDIIFGKLDALVYRLGQDGHHIKAYAIERELNKLKSFVNNK